MAIASILLLAGITLLIHNNNLENAAKNNEDGIINDFEKTMDQYSLLDENGNTSKDLSWLDENDSVGTKYSKTINGIKYIGILYFPSLSNLSVAVADDCTDSNLKLAACRYYGNVNEDNMVIAGHSYKAIFGKLSNYLNSGDIIYFKTLSGEVYKYKLVKKEKLNPNQVSEMVDTNYSLTLFTCTYDNKERIAFRFNIDN